MLWYLHLLLLLLWFFVNSNSLDFGAWAIEHIVQKDMKEILFLVLGLCLEHADMVCVLCLTLFL